ncbi:hypothetical protein ACIF8T_27625 [Streptomyces sp. NPDC085946]|uniref:hypothetical protein n=1 Tax=Streptomyces sp. NPDC085946 TaxID=3365744 RepID=UPI0037D58F99
MERLRGPNGLVPVTSDYGAANHQPKAAVDGALRRTVDPGQVVSLDTSSSSETDGDALSFQWWQYHDADSVSTRVTVNNASSPAESRQ